MSGRKGKSCFYTTFCFRICFCLYVDYSSRILSLVFCLQWRSMSKEQQSVYFKMAEQLRHIHKLNNPNWSNQLNYVRIWTPLILRLLLLRIKNNHRLNVQFLLFRAKRDGETEGETKMSPRSPKPNI